MSKAVMQCVIAVLSLLSWMVSADVETQPFRNFGYLLGDILEQKISLEVDGAPAEIQKLPEQQRKGRWLYLVSTDIQSDRGGRRWLTLRYQIINAPAEPVAAALPSLSLITTTGKTIEVASVPFGLLPMTLAVKSKDSVLPVMQDDHQAQMPDGSDIQKQLIYTAAALALTLLSWMGWWLWRQYSDATRLPFAKAMHQLRKLRVKQGEQQDENPLAWSILHNAFNETAGYTLSSQTIADLIQKEHWLQAFELRIKNFYRISDARFFQPDATVDSFPLADLCKALYLAEKNNSVAVGLINTKGGGNAGIRA